MMKDEGTERVLAMLMFNAFNALNAAVHTGHAPDYVIQARNIMRWHTMDGQPSPDDQELMDQVREDR